MILVVGFLRRNKRVISGFSGFLYGFFGIRWLILSIAFMFPEPDCGPGTKDWGEPVGREIW